MVPGYNTDFQYRGQTFHVQTEDNGVGNPVVVSLLYHQGAILASRKTSYRDLLGKADSGKQLKELMRTQHKALMRELLAGAYDAKIPEGAAKAGAAGSPAAAPASTPAVTAPRSGEEGHGAAATLDEGIMRYLEDHAAAAAAAR
jgi:hypothetical protein